MAHFRLVSVTLALTFIKKIESFLEAQKRLRIVKYVRHNMYAHTLNFIY